MKAAAHQLRPGGTFAASLFAYCIITNNDELNRLWMKLFTLKGATLVTGLAEGNLKESFRRAMEVAASDYDAVKISEEDFLPQVQRLRLNYPEGFSMRDFLVSEECDDEIPRTSVVRGSEQVIHEQQPGWECTTDRAGLKQVLDSFPIDQDTEEFSRLWDKFSRLIGDQKVDCIWPATLILATRRCGDSANTDITHLKKRFYT